MTRSTCTPTRPTSTTWRAPTTWTATSLPASTCQPSTRTSRRSPSEQWAWGPGAVPGNGRGRHEQGGQCPVQGRLWPSAGGPGEGAGCWAQCWGTGVQGAQCWVQCRHGSCREDFYKLVSGLTITKGPRGANTTFDLYAEPWALDAPQETKKKTVVDFETDILFLVPTRIALAQHRANAKSAKTYTYLFSHPSRMPVYPKWVGADHADDIQYVFGKPFATPLGYRSQDRTVSKAMIAYWTNFARSGDPNMGHSAVPTHWAPYTVESDNYLEINRKIDGSSMKQHLRTDYLRYWTLTYQALPTVTGDGAPAPPSGDSDAAPAPPSGDSDAAPAPPSGDSDAAPAPPSGGL
uniref:Carboxylesterase type B domain-containing protein n=1 Tax=Suricata suricatta TaxID=37032 RepID=A0A673VTL5_SURSU